MVRLVVVSRHCTERAGTKPRPAWFDKRRCFEGLRAEIPDVRDLIVVYDHTNPVLPAYIEEASSAGHRVVLAECGSDRRSMLAALKTAFSANLADDDIVYFVEDDYLHMPGWRRALLEAFEHGVAQYVTLYDHPNKYGATYSYNIPRVTLLTPSTHWQTAVSTTNTFAATFKTLHRDLSVHVKAATAGEHHIDHEKFLALWSRGASLASCLPGWSTHCHEPFLSPRVDWAAVAAGSGQVEAHVFGAQLGPRLAGSHAIEDGVVGVDGGLEHRPLDQRITA